VRYQTQTVQMNSSESATVNNSFVDAANLTWLTLSLCPTKSWKLPS